MPRVLYLVYWGAGEPLGQSLVLPPVRLLAERGVQLTLVTFEKAGDRARTDEVAAIRTSLEERGVRWLPLPYHKRPRLLAKGLDFLQAWATGLAAALRSRFDIVHARTFLGGLMGLPLAKLLGARLVYHNEGFYPDEQVDGGVWRFGSFPHRLARALEQQLYARADGIIAMSYRGKAVIDQLPAVRRRRTPTIVVPSCVDLNLFRWNPIRAPASQGQMRLVYIGSIGLRYVFDKVARFVAVAHRELGGVQLRVLTRTDPAIVNATLRSAGVPEGTWSIDSVPHRAMPGELLAQDAGLFFLSQGLSEHGCSPTKIGEYWASGLPVVTTPNVSDTDEITQRLRVGVVLGGHSDEEYGRAARELRRLLADADLPGRCRQAAEQHYALDASCERQLELYQEILPARAIVGEIADGSRR